VARFWKHYLPTLSPLQEMRLPEVMKNGYAALDVMEGHLAATPFFVGGKYGLADIALYAYTHVADEGGFDLQAYPAIRAWLAQVELQPGYVGIDA
jgi:glutathione S-transferase